MEADAIEIRLRAERRLGEMINDQKRTVGPPRVFNEPVTWAAAALFAHPGRLLARFP